jgi:hypothetical protein
MAAALGFHAVAHHADHDLLLLALAIEGGLLFLELAPGA